MVHIGNRTVFWFMYHLVQNIAHTGNNTVYSGSIVLYIYIGISITATDFPTLRVKG